MTSTEHLQQLELLGPSGEWALDQIISLTLEIVELKRQRQNLQEQLDRQDQQLAELQRQAHRQAAPFRRPEEQRNPHPARPGRQKGHAGVCRPKPDHIDNYLEVDLPVCPHCLGAVQDKQRLVQYIEEIPPVRPFVTQLTTEQAWCEHCQREVHSTHPLQVSAAGGCARVHLGPRALALACDLNKAKGLSMRNTVRIMQDYFGLKLSPGGLSHALQRVGRRLEPEYEQMQLELRQKSVVHCDETSWWVSGPGWWLWVFTTQEMTFYTVQKSRASGVILGVLGTEFGGTLVSDCLNIYDGITHRQQKCYSHHLKAVRLACQAHPTQGNDYLFQIQALLRTVIFLKALQEQAEPERFKVCVTTLQARAHCLLDQPRPQAQEESVRMRLWKQRDHLFTCLEHPEVPTTNNQAERQLRPAVIARKISCGNKTPAGAQAWAILSSAAASCRQQRRCFVRFVADRVQLHPTRGP